MRAAALSAAVAVALAMSGAARAQDFYHGKTISVVVGFTPGGGFDTVARVVARHLGVHVPGRPNVVVQNMPGAASITSVLALDANEPRDGTVIDTFNFGEITDSKLEPAKVKVDFRNYAWLGSVSADTTVCYVWHTLGVNTLAQLQTHGPIHTGLTAIGSSSDLNQRILKSIFGVKIQQVPGYPGSAEERLGIERGELDGDCGAWSSLPRKWIDDHLIRPLVRSSPSLSPGMPEGIPYIETLAPNEKDRKVMDLLLASGEIGRPFILSKAVPAERTAILRKAFDDTMRDPAFVADLEKLQLPYGPKTAQESERILRAIYDAPEDVAQAARAVATR